jgi:hypothetical protein
VLLRYSIFVNKNRYISVEALAQSRKSSVAKAKAATRKDCSRKEKASI